MKKSSTIGNILSKVGPLLALIVLYIILSIASNVFLTVNNQMNVLRQTAVNGLISSGMLIVLITAGIDLSVGGNAITSSCMMGMLMNNFGVTNPFVLIITCLATGVVIGLINGLLLTKLHLPHPFVSTLGMKNVLCGMALLVVATKTVYNFPKGVVWLGDASLFKSESFSGVPVCFITLIIIYIIFHLLLNNVTFGKTIYAIGGNAEAARLSGINSDRALTIVYMICGFMAALAGLVIVGRTGVANPSSAISPYDTDAIAACIIGGASFQGGKGTIWGTLIGALIISVIRNGLTLLDAKGDIQYIVIGLVIIISVFIDVTRTRMEAKARLAASAED